MEPVADLMGGLDNAAETAHVTGRASGSVYVIGAPLVGRCVPVPRFAARSVYVSVFRLLVDFMLWVVRAEMALAACFRLAGLFDAELVSRVTGSTGTEASVGIDPADAGIWPAFKRAVFLRDDETAVAFNASEVYVVVMVRGIVEQPDLRKYSAVRKQRS